MRIAILSDVHGNLPAFDAVLADAVSCDAIWNLGDTVGYGPDPVGCLDRLAAARPAVSLVGNHDLACIGELDVTQFNLVARLATTWTASQLDETHREQIRAMDPAAVVGEATLAHGSPRSPVWEYVLSAEVAAENMTEFLTSLCFVGHTHVAAIATTTGAGPRIRFTRTTDGQLLDVAHDRWIINPGSVGQPRDGDPRAAYVVYDTEQATVLVRRVPYLVADTQARIAAVGLPDVLGARLALGR